MIGEVDTLCLCGCGLPVKPGNRYAAAGHNRRGLKVPDGVGNRSPECRAKMAESARKRWADPEKRAAVVAAQNEGKDTPEFRQFQSEKSLRYIREYGTDHLARGGRRVHSEEEREGRRQRMMALMDDPVERARRLAACAAARPSGRERTWPEIVVAKTLEVMGIEFVEQAQVDGSPRVWDFKAGSTLLEVDGCYWHCCPTCMGDRLVRVRSAQRRNMAKDPERETVARELGYRFIRVWEHETSDVGSLWARLKAELQSE